MSIDWSNYNGEDKGYRSITTGNQYVSEQTIIDVWRYLHANDYVLGNFVFEQFLTADECEIKGLQVYAAFWADNYDFEDNVRTILHSPYFMVYASSDPRFLDVQWSGTKTYDEDEKIVYYAYWNNTYGTIRLNTGEGMPPILNPYDKLPANVKQNPASAAWEMVYESVPGAQMTDEQILTLLKSTTNIWDNKVTIEGKDYPYLPPLS